MNNKIIIGAILLVLVISGIYYLIMRPKYSAQNSSSSSNATSAPVSTNMVSINNFAFNPGVITVKKGTTVTWVNNDSVTHTVKGNTFSSPDISPGGKFEFTFNNAGTFNYNCAIPPSMQGEVIVE